MRCSKCREVIRPVVALDIDGTLADYHEWFGHFACRYWNRTHPKGRWRGDGEFEDYLGLTKAEYREAKTAYRQGGMKRIQPLFEGAKELCDGIMALGAELWITTTRPWKRFDNIDPDTQWWLDTNRIRYDNLLYDRAKYDILFDRVGGERVVFALEDLPDLYSRAKDLFGDSAVMVERLHNLYWRQEWLDSTSAVTVPTLYAALDLARVRIMAWYEYMEDIA
jgi:hypothetical protein